MSVNSKMTAIANAIRSKTGQSGALTLDQMAAAISGLSIGDKTIYSINCTTKTSENILLGDVNNDGVIDSDDVTAIGELVGSDNYNEAADLDNDGVVTFSDLFQLNNFVTSKTDDQVIGRVMVTFNDDTSCISCFLVDSRTGTVELDTLTNPASADDIVSGKRAYSDQGSVIIGTNTDSATISSELARINTATGQSDSTLTAAVTRLISGLSGGDIQLPDDYTSYDGGSFVPLTDVTTSIDVNHSLAAMPKIVVVWTENAPLVDASDNYLSYFIFKLYMENSNLTDANKQYMSLFTYNGSCSSMVGGAASYRMGITSSAITVNASAGYPLRAGLTYNWIALA